MFGLFESTGPSANTTTASSSSTDALVPGEVRTGAPTQVCILEEASGSSPTTTDEDQLLSPCSLSTPGAGGGGSGPFTSYRRSSMPHPSKDEEWTVVNHTTQTVLRAPSKRTSVAAQSSLYFSPEDTNGVPLRRRENSYHAIETSVYSRHDSSSPHQQQQTQQPPMPTKSKLRQGKRKLVLHFDARNTVFVADLFSRISVEHALNTYIAGVVWGVQNPDRTWQCISRIPTLQKPQQGAVSLYKVTEADIVKKPEDRAILRQVLGNFTQTPGGSPFADVFHQHLRMLAWPYPERDDKLTVTGLDGQPYHYLLPAFYELIRELFISGRDFCVLVRTFGRDAPHILSAVRRFSLGMHPQFPECFPLPVRKDEELLKRSEDGLVYTFVDETGQKVELTQGADIYQHWNSSYGVVGVVDDFEFWQNHQYHFSASKPLWFNPDDYEHVQHVMFDDNIRMEDDDNIINLRRLQDHGDGRLLEPQEGLQYENVHYVQADLLECIRNPNYFIEMINLCEENLEKQTLERETAAAIAGDS